MAAARVTMVRLARFSLMLLPFVSGASFAATTPNGPVASSGPSLTSAAMCQAHFARAEREQGIPKQLLAAIADTESGRWSDEAGAVVPWPWTINTGGKGYYFDSMHEAVTFAKRLQQKGIDNMDVGCMQVNLHHHPLAFTNLIEAFDPEYNVAYGAKFLRQNYDDLKTWPAAIAAYHSRTPSEGNPYYASVRRNWAKVLSGGTVAIADSGAPYGANTAYVNGIEVKRGSQASIIRKASKPRASEYQISVRDSEGDAASFRRLSERDRASRAEARLSAPSVIHVDQALGGRAHKAPEVLVVRPVGEKETAAADIAPKAKPISFSGAGASDEVVIAMRAPGEATSESFVSGRRQALNSGITAGTASSSAAGNPGASVKRVSSRRTGPNFIFD